MAADIPIPSFDEDLTEAYIGPPFLEEEEYNGEEEYDEEYYEEYQEDDIEPLSAQDQEGCLVLFIYLFYAFLFGLFVLFI